MKKLQLHHGDCLDVMKALPDNSVDSIVTDPPYGLSFMGKKWDYDVPSVDVWAECLRVLKPGGHLLAFSGTRTQHRMAVRIEDAGFEIRDMIAWVYGSGFPKSLDVSKAIDKTGGQSVAWFGPWFRKWREEKGITQKQVAALFPSKTGGLTGCVANWELGLNMPTPEQFNLIRDTFGLPFDSVEEAEREVVGKRKVAPGVAFSSEGPTQLDVTAPATDAARQWQGWGTALKPALEPITVARKPLGTCATNVLQMVESQLRERGVRGGILWKPENASGVARSKKTTSSGSTRPSERSATSAKTADESVTQSAEQQSLKSSEQLGTSGLKQTQGASESFQGCTTSGCGNPSSAPMEGSAHAAESVSATSSPSTTSTEAEPSTASKFTGRCTPNCAETVSRPDTESFAGIATGLTGSMETVRISLDSEGFFLWPKGLPEFVPGSPLTVAANVLEHGTGALNIDGCRVQSTDRPNACKGTGWAAQDKKNAEQGFRPTAYYEGQDGVDYKPHDAGRWPANLIHDGSEEVLATFPQAKGQQGDLIGHAKTRGNGIYGDMPPARDAIARIESDTSAARFFYCAKASKKDRDEGLEGFALQQAAGLPMRAAGGERGGEGLDGSKTDRIVTRANTHPTVKPTELMAYLCRLVTPPGGVVLDPFMGSGSTGKAAVRYGFRFIGIEREAEYMAIASARIKSASAQGSLL